MPKRNLARLQMSLKGGLYVNVCACACVEHVCPKVGQGGALVFLLLFPLVTLLFLSTPHSSSLYTTQSIRKTAVAPACTFFYSATHLMYSCACTHTHTAQHGPQEGNQGYEDSPLLLWCQSLGKWSSICMRLLLITSSSASDGITVKASAGVSH